MKQGTFVAAAFAAVISFVPGTAQAQVPASDAWQGKVVPLDVFGQFPNLQRPRISPDGQLIAARIRDHGTQALAVVPLNQGAGKPQIIARDGNFSKDKIGEREVVDWSWINADTVLFTLRSHDNAYGQWYDNYRLAAYNVSTHEVTPLGWDHAVASAANILWRTPPGDDDPHILLERQSNAYGSERIDNPEVIDIDVDTGKYKIAMRPNPEVSSWVADTNGVIRMGSERDRDSGKMRVMYRPDDDTHFDTIYNDTPEHYSDVALPSIIIGGSNKAYTLSNKDGYRALYEYDLSTMAIGDKVFGVDGYDISSPSVTPDGSQLQAYHWTGKRARTEFLVPRLKQIDAVLEDMFGKGDVDIESADTKRENIVFSAAKPGQPPTHYLFNTASGNVQRIAWSNDTLKNAELNPVKMIHYRASDGLDIPAILTLPRHVEMKQDLPLIILPHGGPWIRDSIDWDTYKWAQALAEYGYAVIQPNYRGSTGYGKSFGAAVDGNWGRRMQDDLNDAVTWAADQGIADPDRVCIMGWSYGGYAASRAAQRDGDVYRCAISGAGVHDLPAMVKYDRDYLGRYGAKTGLGAASQDLEAISPSLHAEDFSIPILIVHGARDRRVPVDQSRDLVDRLEKAGKVEGKDFVYDEQPLNTHHLLRETDRVDFLEQVKTFLDKYNPA